MHKHIENIPFSLSGSKALWGNVMSDGGERVDTSRALSLPK